VDNDVSQVTSMSYRSAVTAAVAAADAAAAAVPVRSLPWGAFPRTRSLVRGGGGRSTANVVVTLRVVGNFETNVPLKPPAERDAPTTPRLEGGKENRKRRSKKRRKEKQSSNKYRSGTKQTGEMSETACLAIASLESGMPIPIPSIHLSHSTRTAT
jgi:hypothetical protein